MRLDLVTVIVHDYDPAIRFFVDALGFELIEDSPSTTNDGRPKRWVVVRPPGAETGILLARADGEDQARAVGQQMAGRVGLFLRVDDFERAYTRMIGAGVHFVTAPRDEPYGRIAVFLDIAGNRWDLLGPRPAAIGVEERISEHSFRLRHRVRATNPIGDGWHLAVSTEGGFSVEMPVPFNDFRTRGMARDGVEVRSHSILMKNGPITWTVHATMRRDGRLGIEDHAPRPDRIERKGGDVIKREFDLPGFSCFLMVSREGTAPLPPEADCLRFLHSFRRIRPAVW